MIFEISLGGKMNLKKKKKEIECFILVTWHQRATSASNLQVGEEGTGDQGVASAARFRSGR